MNLKKSYTPPRVCHVLMSEEENLLLGVSFYIDDEAEDDDDSDKVKQSREDWWNENVWEKDWGLSHGSV